MRKIYLAVLAAIASLGLLLGVGISGAAANDYRPCTLTGGVAHLGAYGGGGLLNNVKINSVPELNQSQSHWTAYNESGNAVQQGGFISAPVDGDGFWNYKWNWPTNMGGIERVYVKAVQRSNGSYCGSSLYP